MGLDRNGILDAADLPSKTVQIDEWHGDVIVRCLSAGDAAAWFAAGTDGMESMCRLVALSVVDHNGVRMFTDEDVPALMGKNPNAIRKLFDAALEMSAMSGDADEDAEKN